MAVMADFAKLPQRQKVMLFLVIGGVLGFFYYQFVFKKLKGEIEIEDGRHAQKLAENAKLEKDIPEYAKLKARMVNLKRMIDENQKALPTEAELPAFFDMLNRKVLESGVEVIHVRQAPEAPIESFFKVPVEYEIQGSFLQIKKFFASLAPKKKKASDAPPPGTPEEVEEKERIVSIENLSLANPVVRNREIKLTAKFVVSTYRQEEKAAPAGGAKPKATPAAPAQAPAPAAGSGMAPSTTPKGAQQRTEKALDKADQRTQNGDPAKMKGGVP